MPAVLAKPDYDPEDDEPPAFDPKLAGPEYWLFARELDQERLSNFLASMEK